MMNSIVNDLLTDGYSIWFGVAIVISLGLLGWDILKNGWNLEEGGEAE